MPVKELKINKNKLALYVNNNNAPKMRDMDHKGSYMFPLMKARDLVNGRSRP